ncbi:MAG: DUF6782 family putative metallopeptidase [bacterium]
MPEFKEPIHALDAKTAQGSGGGPLPTAADLGLSARAQSAEIAAAAPAGEAAHAEEGGHAGHAHPHHAPAPAGGGAAPAPAAGDRWTTIETLLKKSPIGTTALDRKTEYSVGVEYQAGTGSFYDSGANKMTLDTTETAEESALTFVHEMNHAHWHHKGLGADVQTMTREAYVQKMLDEEVEGTVLSIESKGEIVDSGTAISATFPLEAEYRAAYDAAKAAGKGAEDCRKAGHERVMQGFKNGEVVTSNNGQSYPDYYGDYWDAVHPASP